MAQAAVGTCSQFLLLFSKYTCIIHEPWESKECPDSQRLLRVDPFHPGWHSTSRESTLHTTRASLLVSLQPNGEALNINYTKAPNIKKSSQPKAAFCTSRFAYLSKVMRVARTASTVDATTGCRAFATDRSYGRRDVKIIVNFLVPDSAKEWWNQSSNLMQEMTARNFEVNWCSAQFKKADVWRGRWHIRGSEASPILSRTCQSGFRHCLPGCTERP